MHFFEQFRPMMKLALPLVAAQLAQVGVEVVDTLFMGRMGGKTLAAGALAIPSILFILIVCIGIIGGMGILIARAYGEKNDAQVKEMFSAGLQLSLWLSLPSILLLALIPKLLLSMGQDPTIIEVLSTYINIILLTYPAMLLFIVLREYLNALNHPNVIMVVSVIAIPLNALGNWLLGFGKFGLPNLGIAGIGWATFLSQWLIVSILFLYIFLKNDLRAHLPRWQLLNKQLKPIKEIVALGLPMGLQGLFEVGLFSITAVMMGFFGQDALAAHQISVQCVTVTFVFFLGISQACSIRMNHCIGAKQYADAESSIYMGLFLNTTISIITATMYWGCPVFFANLYVDIQLPHHAAIVNHTIQFLAIAGLFQIIDALQVTASGVLRGFKDTKIPMLLGISSFWIFGLGSGYYLTFTRNIGSTGLWWGIAIGIGVSAAVLLTRVHIMIKRQLRA